MSPRAKLAFLAGSAAGTWAIVIGAAALVRELAHLVA